MMFNFLEMKINSSLVLTISLFDFLLCSHFNCLKSDGFQNNLFLRVGK